MDKSFIFQIISYYILFLKIKPIKNIMHTLSESETIKEIFTVSKTELFYLTNKSIKQLPIGDSPTTISTTNFYFSQNSDIVIIDPIERKFIITCSSSFLELRDKNTQIIDTIYKDNYENTNIKCSAHYINDYIYIAVSFTATDVDRFKSYCFKSKINLENEIGNVFEPLKQINEMQMTYMHSLKDGNHAADCLNFNDNDEQVYRDEFGELIIQGFSNNIYSNYIFKVLAKDDKEMIIMIFDALNSRNMSINIINETVSDRYIVETKFNFTGSDIFSAIKYTDSFGTKFFTIAYRPEGNSNRLVIETFSEIIEENKYYIKSLEYYEITNNIGYSNAILKRTDDDSDIFIIARGGESNSNTYEYAFKSEFDEFLQEKFDDCSVENKIISKNTSFQEFLMSDIKIKNLDLNGADDDVIFSPEDRVYKILNSTHIKIYLTSFTGPVSYHGIKTKKNNYNFTYNSTYYPLCTFHLVSCNEACYECDPKEAVIAVGSPTKCKSKQCNKGYYYVPSKPTECLKREYPCYFTCNTCPENEEFSINNHNCETCLDEYVLIDKNCLKCDLTKPFYYYSPEKSNNSCVYPEDGCPNELPYSVKGMDGCYDQCPEGYGTEDDESYLCIEKLYYYDENGNKVTVDNGDCVAPAEYTLYDERQCLLSCDLINNIPFGDSKICVSLSKCSGLFIKIENKCDCKDGILTINSLTDIKCITEQDVINDLHINKDVPTLEEKIKQVEKGLQSLKLYEEPIIDFGKGTKFQIINSTNFNDEDSNSDFGSIDLSKCEDKLKSHYNLDVSTPLIILVISTPTQVNSLINNLNFIIFSQSGERLDLNLCANEEVYVYNQLPEDVKIDLELIRRLEELGIDLYDINSPYYHDICFGFSYHGNDIITEDRRKDIYSVVSVCEPGCHFEEFNETTNRAKCKCNMKTKFEENIPLEEAKNFFKSLNDQINYQLVKCFKVFNFFWKQFYKNFGFYLWFTSFLSLIIGFHMYLISSKDTFFNQVSESFEKNKDKNKDKQSSNPPKKRNMDYNPFENTKSKTGIDAQSEIELNPKKSQKNIILPYDTKSKNTNNIINLKKNKNSPNYLIIKDSKGNNEEPASKTEKNIESTVTERNLVSQVNNSTVLNKFRKPYIIGKPKEEEEKKSFEERLTEKYHNFFVTNDKDNYWGMSYGNAIELDHRLFYQSYYSFLFYKFDLFSIIFFPDTYEYYTITIPFYIFSLLFDFTINSLLYADDIVHQKYANKGKLYFYTSFLLGLISNIISYIVIKYIRKLITISFAFEALQYEIGEEDEFKEYSKYLLGIANRRLILGFFLEIIICFACGYYIYIFCEIYRKSQISLFINFLVGVATSVVYVIFIGLVVCILRRIAIRCKKKKLYYSSKYLSDLI